MKFGVVVFPGTWSDVDCFDVLNDVFNQPVEYVWHKDTDLSPYDCIILPGGFSYGDYLRPGAIARFSPAMQAVTDFAQRASWLLASATAFRFCARPDCCRAFYCQMTICSSAASGRICGWRMRGQHLQAPHQQGRHFVFLFRMVRATISPNLRSSSSWKSRSAWCSGIATRMGETTTAANPTARLTTSPG